jgi:hypothetical protein
VSGNPPEFYAEFEAGIILFKDDQKVTTALFPLAAVSAVQRVHVKDGHRSPVRGHDTSCVRGCEPEAGA